MRRLLFVATGAFFVVATLLPTQRPSLRMPSQTANAWQCTANRQSSASSMAACGQILFAAARYQPQYITCRPSPSAPGSSSVPTDTLPPTRTSSR